MHEMYNSKNTCLVCGSKKLHYDFSLRKYRVEECADCGLMRLNPQPTDLELSEIYSSNYLMNSEDATRAERILALKSATADNYLNHLESYLGETTSRDLLEIGCGKGDFLLRAISRKFNVVGIEDFAPAAEVAAKKVGQQGRIISGGIDQAISQQLCFDVIVFTDMLEHIRDPRGFLKQVYGLLKPNGVIMVVVPSLDSLPARFMRDKWLGFKPEHLWYFSTKTLTRLLYQEGFGTIKTKVARKNLSFNHIKQHFKNYPIQPYTNIIKLVGKFLPNFLKDYSFSVISSGILTLARKNIVTSNRKLSIIIPAFNEAQTIKQVIEQILKKKILNVDIEIIIVESNSTDNTRAIVSEYQNYPQIKLILQKEPLGKGCAVREGFKHVTGDYILIQDADDEYDIEDYDALLEPLLDGETAFVLGARHGGGAWKMRNFTDQRFLGHFLNFGHWFFTTLINITLGLRLKDPFTMYKVFRVDCLHNLKFDARRFDFDFELLIKLVRSGYKPIEIPVNYRSRSFKQGKKVNMWRDPLTWLKAIVKYRFQKL